MDYTDVPAGNLALNNAADLYLYPNSLCAVKVDGAGLKAWLEQAAGRFQTIDPARTTQQELVDPLFPTYNFDADEGGDALRREWMTTFPSRSFPTSCWIVWSRVTRPKPSRRIGRGSRRRILRMSMFGAPPA